MITCGDGLLVEKCRRMFPTATDLYTVGLSNLHDATLITHQRRVKRAADLHWLDVWERVLYKLAVTIHRYLQHKTPQYLLNYCIPVSEVASLQHLRSATRHRLLLVPRCRLSTFGRRAFPIAGPTFWNSLADEMRTCSSDRFKAASVVKVVM